MVFRCLFVFIVLLPNFSLGQKIVSGEYDFGLKLAFDNKTNKLTGYFENYAGWDEGSNQPQFSCIFYIEASVLQNKAKIATYYPGQKAEESINGEIQIINNKILKIKLLNDHGGCWNVQSFSSSPVEFSLLKGTSWIQIRYVVSEKSYFYSDKNANTKQKAYVVKNNFVSIEKTEGDWAFCTFYGKKITKGWLQIKTLNFL